jgi:hypothetical protein
MTRLGEFSPIGRVFPLGSNLKTTEVANVILGNLVTRLRLSINFDKNWATLWAFFENSSGHPGCGKKMFILFSKEIEY